MSHTSLPAHTPPARKWGIWNNRQQEFQFGISEDTEEEAIDALFEKIGKDANRWRFEAKKLPMNKQCRGGKQMKCRISIVSESAYNTFALALSEEEAAFLEEIAKRSEENASSNQSPVLHIAREG